MEYEELDKQKLINHWLVGSDEDFKTMIAMFDAKRFSWALFVGHLVIEKLLKAYFVDVNGGYPPFTHNLLKLALDAHLQLTEEKKYVLTTITAFNINTRYDDYKMSFQKQCTDLYTHEWIDKIKELRLWIKEQIKP